MGDAKDFSARVELLVEAAGSQRKLAALIGVSPGTVGLWMSTTKKPYESTFRDIASKTGVPYDWITSGKGDDKAALAAFRAKQQSKMDFENSPRMKLKRARENAGYTVTELAKRTGYQAAVLIEVEDGTARASDKMIAALCRELPELTPEDLKDGSDEPEIKSETGMEGTYGAEPNIQLPPGVKGRYVPLLSKAEAGTWNPDHSDGLYNYTGVFAMNVDDRRAFAIKVSGDSMEPELFDGDMVICSPSQAQPQNGVASVVQTKSENVYIKFWHKKGERVLLESANPAHKPIEYPLSEITGAWPIIQTVSSKKIIKQL